MAAGTGAEEGTLDGQVDDHNWLITLNRPERLNALDAALVDRLLAQVQEANARNARLIVFRGSGRSFSAGFDLSGIGTQSEGDLVLRFVRIEMLLQAVATSPARTLGLAHGRVFGAGADLFAACRTVAALRSPVAATGALAADAAGAPVWRRLAARLLSRPAARCRRRESPVRRQAGCR